jgi:hypothetical protein
MNRHHEQTEGDGAMSDEVEKGFGSACNAPCPFTNCDKPPCKDPPNPGDCVLKCYLPAGHQYKDPDDPNYSPVHACKHGHRWRAN